MPGVSVPIPEDLLGTLGGEETFRPAQQGLGIRLFQAAAVTRTEGVQGAFSLRCRSRLTNPQLLLDQTNQVEDAQFPPGHDLFFVGQMDVIGELG